ncbi:MAG: hypothetical protein IPN63_07075 [Gammaproteobacteria bacterium]|nr:hypothetical protein [Gammaproteobacteria bacterium]
MVEIDDTEQSLVAGLRQYLGKARQLFGAQSPDGQQGWRRHGSGKSDQGDAMADTQAREPRRAVSFTVGRQIGLPLRIGLAQGAATVLSWLPGTGSPAPAVRALRASAAPQETPAGRSG